MLLISIILLILTFITVMLVSGNNLSVCVGPAIGSRILSKKFGVLLGAVGFSLGLLLQGVGMTKSIDVLLPNAALELRAEALLVAIIIFAVADLLKAPMSFSMSLFGMLAGLSIAGGSFADGAFLAEVGIMWVAAPFIAVALAFYFAKILNQSSPKNFWKRLQIFKVAVIILSFSSAYVLGANTLGLIVATGGFNLTTVLAAVAAIFIGAFFLSSGEIKRVSQELFLMRYPNATVTLVTSTFLVELATVFNIPLSNTQALSAAIFGTALSYKTKLVSIKPFLTIAVGWIVAPLISFTIGLLIG